MNTHRTRCMYDPAVGDLWIADIGHEMPTRAIHFDSSIEAEEYCEARGFVFLCLGFDPAMFPNRVSNKMNRILSP